MGRERSGARRLGNLAAVPQKASELGVEPILPFFLNLSLFPNFFFFFPGTFLNCSDSLCQPFLRSLLLSIEVNL